MTPARRTELELPGPIPSVAVTAWRRVRPWRDDRQVEQDLYLSRAAIAIAVHPALADTLAWRGGTCLHKLRLDAPRRYSEDLDYVQVGGAADLGWMIDALRDAAVDAGMLMTGSQHSKVRVKGFFGAKSNFGAAVKVKVEVNVDDAEPAMGLEKVRHEIDATRWWSGGADILTYQPPELIGTKFRALAQRSKGRDLWDVDLARRELGIDDTELAACAVHYLRHEGISPWVFRQRLAANLDVADFRNDLGPLLAGADDGYDATAVGLDLTLWSDVHLDRLWEAGMTNTARAKRERLRRELGLAGRDDLLQCPRYELTSGRTYVRCSEVLTVGQPCPAAH